VAEFSRRCRPQPQLPSTPFHPEIYCTGFTARGSLHRNYNAGEFTRPYNFDASSGHGLHGVEYPGCTHLQVFELGFESTYIVLLVFFVGNARLTDMERGDYLRLMLANNPPSLVIKQSSQNFVPVSSVPLSSISVASVFVSFV
jgi:hypothetical protein